MSTYFFCQTESTGHFAYIFVFWFFWAWMHAALLWHSVYRDRQGTAIYGAAVWHLEVMPEGAA